MSRTPTSFGLIRRSARLERVKARAPRYLLIAALGITSLIGVRELLYPMASAPDRRPAVVDHAAEELAQRLARAYLSYDAQRPALRERALRSVGAGAADFADGLSSGPGSQQVLWTEIAQNQEAIAGGRVIVVAAGVDTQAEALYIAVPVIRGRAGALALAGYPALVGAPATAGAPQTSREQVDDEVVLAVARRAIVNYLAGEPRNLAADLAPGVEISLATRRLRVRSIEEVSWAAGEGSSAVLVTVLARDEAGALWTLTYELGIQRRPGERPYVTFVETIPNAP